MYNAVGSVSGTISGNIRPMDRDEFYTVLEAAKVLGVTDRHVRKLAADGRIEGERADNGWILFRRSVHEFRDQRRPHERPPDASIWPVEARNLLEEVRALERELGRLQGQRELEAVAESTLRESLERERQWVDAERERAEQERREREQIQEEARRLREELEEARRPWWMRWFGG
jgi:excisionase family DNA binding protein